MQTATSHHLSLSSLNTHSERDKLSNFLTKDIFMKKAAEAIYFSFLASLATVVL
jgi:hypothetical protein